MFITRDIYKSPLSAFFMGSDEDLWSATELALQQSWFLAHLEEVESEDDAGYTSNRTVLLCDFKSVEPLLHLGQADQPRLKSVHIVTPGHVNGSGHWQMDRLQAVWQGRELVDSHEIPTDIFETVSGKRYSASFCCLSAEQMVGETLRFQFD